MTTLDLTTTPSPGGWTCEVTIGNGTTTRHRVRVSRTDLARLSPDASDPEDLVRASFAFLLEREPNESILREFDLPVIGRYYPEYEREIGPRLTG